VLEVEGQDAGVELQLAGPVQEVAVEAVAVDVETTGDPDGDGAVVGVRGPVGVQGVAKVRDEGPLIGPVLEALVAAAHRARDDVRLELVEPLLAPVCHADLEEAHHVLQVFVLDLAALGSELRERHERADRRLDVDRDVDPAHELGERLPGAPVVDEDRVDAGGQRVEGERAQRDGLAGAGVRDHQAVVGRAEPLVEEVEPEGVLTRGEHQARGPRTAPPGREDREEVPCVA